MSNAFRNPVSDPVRNIIRSLMPTTEGAMFSLRDQRSSVKAFYRASVIKRLIQQNIRSGDRESLMQSVGQLVDFSSSINPRICGKGLWFKKWAAFLESDVKAFLDQKSAESTIFRDILPEASTFASPLQVTKARHPHTVSTEALDEALSNFRRVVAATYFRFPKLYFEPKDVRGLAFQKRRLECHTPSKWGKYEIRCDGSGREYVAYIKNRATRETILKEYFSVFDDTFHDALLAVLKERKRLAQKLGFASWTDMQAATTNGSTETEALAFIEDVYKAGQPYIQSLLGRLRKIPLDYQPSGQNKVASFPASRQAWTTVDESYLLTSYRPAVHETKVNELFEYNLIFDRIIAKIGELFSVKFEPVNSSLLMHGWHPSVRIFRVKHSDGNYIGYIYVDLFRRMSGLGGMGPHCTALSPSHRHVRIYMGLQPPYRSDITFKKERYFTYEEITALMHELGHAMHVLLKPQTAPMAQLPMDLRESISILMELFSLTNEFQDYLTDKKLSPRDREVIRRDEWFYVEILRNVALSEYLHSSKFDPDTSTPEDLKRFAREVYARYCPIPLADFVNPLGGEVTNYLLDGESRVGYLHSYMRSSSWLRERDTMPALIQRIRASVIDKTFPPFVSPALESRLNGQTGLAHPLNGELVLSQLPGSSISTSSIWEFGNAELKRKRD